MFKKKTLVEYSYICFGSLIYSLGVTFFLMPANAYSGGILGIAQLIRTFLFAGLGKEIFNGYDPTGIINFILNIPLLILAYRKLSKDFFVKTLFTILVQTICMSFIKVPTHLIMDDTLSSMIVAGIMAGIGLGIVLRAGGCSAGLDIVGIYLSKRYQNLSVGKISMGINYFIYALFAVLFQLKTAIYSFIFAFIVGLVVDKIHLQNIKTKVIVITKSDQVHREIVNQIGRGVTYWRGTGAYSNQPMYIMLTLVSKYELGRLKKIVSAIDESAFIIHSDGNYVFGNFEKRLDN